jgi:2-polyprenyl-3-methyl-5-hydroxy-6-metoxy-1,4-benzoquinol methylase
MQQLLTDRRAPISLDTAAWGRSAITQVDLELLAEQTRLSTGECLKRLNAYRLEDMAQAWTQANPRSSGEIRRFYAETDHYLWELLGWNGSPVYLPYLRRVDRLAATWPPSRHPRALDYGSGVGSAALRLAELGYRVTLADVPGKTLAFAQARFARRGIPFDTIEVTDDVPHLPAAAWDVVVSFDVLEHLPSAAVIMGRLARSLVAGGGAAIVASFEGSEELWPHHLPGGRAQFAGARWELYLSGLGMQNVGDYLYRKLDQRAAVLRRARYELWRATGVYVQRLER